MYDAVMPHASFLQFYWAWRALFGGLFSASKFSVPDASAYHCISTGYAGLVAARATLETGRPAALTEHEICTNERRIEILMAEWIADTVEKGLAFDDARTDIRDLSIQVFEAYARITYQACTSITTLYSGTTKSFSWRSVLMRIGLRSYPMASMSVASRSLALRAYRAAPQLR